MATAPLRISLDPASVLYFRKLAVRKQPIRNAVPLPGFTWEAERSRMPGVADKDVAKLALGGVARAWRAMQDKGDAAFVALIKFTVTPERFRLRIDCPYRNVLEPFVDMNARNAVAAHPGIATLNVRHRYALMDELCPMVFVWQQAADEVLITNEFHVGNPEQFLAIDRVGTTSGLLNFIGAMSLMQASDQQAQFAARMPGLLKDAMAARADEWLRWVHHLVDEQVIFDPKRLLVDERDPEQYFYDYSGKPL